MSLLSNAKKFNKIKRELEQRQKQSRFLKTNTMIP